MPVVWRVLGEGIGPGGSNGMFFTDKASAKAHLRQWRTDGERKRTEGSGPDQVKLSGREEIVDALNQCLAQGVSTVAEETEDDDDDD